MKIRQLASFAAAVLLASTMTVAAQDKVNVKLSYIVDHPAIDAARKGITDTLTNAGFVEGESMNLEVQSAQGNMSTQAQINQKFVGDNPDLIIAISTPSAQTAMAATKTIPIVFAAVTDPEAAGLVDSYANPGRNLTGSSDLSPIDKHLKLITQIVPTAKRVGVIYNGGEANSIAQVKVINDQATQLGLKVVEATAVQSSAVLDAARSLVGKVDVIYVPSDSTVVSGTESIVRVGIDAQIPVFAADTNLVERGVIAALGFSYYDIGVAAGESAVKVLQGTNPAEMPVRFQDKLELYLNPGSASKMGVTLSDELIATASKVVK